ncbi:MAG: hypothetical protein VKJ06_06080 [Vampirovibrionales bacterium]|nr:hypothetical protein [Vampirovibrionales bacterium]
MSSILSSTSLGIRGALNQGAASVMPNPNAPPKPPTYAEQRAQQKENEAVFGAYMMASAASGSPVDINVFAFAKNTVDNLPSSSVTAYRTGVTTTEQRDMARAQLQNLIAQGPDTSGGLTEEEAQTKYQLQVSALALQSNKLEVAAKKKGLEIMNKFKQLGSYYTQPEKPVKVHKIESYSFVEYADD